MADDSLLAELAEEFTGELRAGKPADIEEYVRKYPELAERIRELFPTLMMLEGMAATAKSAKEIPLSILAPGSTFGEYRIERELGRGGMGAVYEAEQIETGRRVALKVLTHRLDSAEARARFFREGRLAASINHPNSVYVYGTGEIEGTPVIVMELINGSSLQERVKRDGPLP